MRSLWIIMVIDSILRRLCLSYALFPSSMTRVSTQASTKWWRGSSTLFCLVIIQDSHASFLSHTVWSKMSASNLFSGYFKGQCWESLASFFIVLGLAMMPLWQVVSWLDSNYQEQCHFCLPPTLLYMQCHVPVCIAFYERNAASSFIWCSCGPLRSFLGLDVWVPLVQQCLVIHLWSQWIAFLKLEAANLMAFPAFVPWPALLHCRPPFRSDSYAVANKSSLSVVRTNDFRRSTRLHFADFPQKVFSATKKQVEDRAHHFVSVTRVARQERDSARRIKSSKFEYFLSIPIRKICRTWKME
jgi:hypothetical protein